MDRFPKTATASARYGGADIEVSLSHDMDALEIAAAASDSEIAPTISSMGGHV